MIGATDLLLAVATGAALSLAGIPEMQTIGTFPVVLVPLFGVGLTFASHVVAFDLLLRQRRAARPPALA